MNKKLTWVVMALALMGGPAALAQEATGIPPLAIRATRSAGAALEPLKQNVTLTLETNGPKGNVPIQITWTGAGPKLGLQFLTPWPTAADLSHCVSGSFQGTISEVEGAYQLEYEVEGYEPLASANVTSAAGPSNVQLLEKSEYAVQSKVVLKPGEPVTDSASAVVLVPTVGPVHSTCPVKLTLTVAK